VLSSAPFPSTVPTSSMSLDGRDVAGTSQLVCILQDGSQTDSEDSPKREKYLSDVKRVTVDRSGTVGAPFTAETRNGH
jgi:hypothetical protein